MRIIISGSGQRSPDFSGVGGVDGELCQLTIFGDLSSSIRFQWWSDYPENWKSLVDAANDLLQGFQSATAVDFDAEP